MELQQNISDILKKAKKYRSQNLSELADEFETARSHMCEFLKEKGNPRLDTVVHIARKAGIDPVELITNSFGGFRFQTIDLLLRSCEAAGLLNTVKRWALAAQILEKVETAELALEPVKPYNGMEDAILVETRKYMALILKTVKTYRGQSLKEFAKSLNISRSHLQDILNEKRNPRWSTVKRIANKLAIEPAALISRSFTSRQFHMIDIMIRNAETLRLPDFEKRQSENL